tara:strand:- start:515 stop:772 length:258 start_codon:yes stop_codon:yes gene_type:complete
MEENKQDSDSEIVDTIIVILRPNGDVLVVNADRDEMTVEQGEMLTKIICVIHEPSVVLSAILKLEMFFRYITEVISAWFQRKYDD